MKKFDWLISVVAGVVFLFLSSWYISLPGLNYDESLCAAPAVNFVVDNPNSEPTQINPSVIYLFGRPIPMMLMTYIGPVKTILYIPIFWILDVSVFTVRLLPLIIMFLCFPLAYYLFKEIFNREVAIFTVFLMSVDPSIVFYLTRDVGPATLQVFFKLLALMFFIKWWESKKNIFLYLGFFVLGLGVTHKVDFLWVIVGMIVPVTIFYFCKLKERLNIKVLMFSGLFFAIGAFPIILFNIYTGGYTFSPMTDKFLSSKLPSDAYFLSNLITRASQIIEIHNGNFIAFLFCEKNVYHGFWKYIHLIFLSVSIFIILFYLIIKTKPKNFLNILAIVVYILIVTIETCFSPTVLSGHHLLALTPFITVVIVYAILSMKYLKNAAKYFVLIFLMIYLLYSTIRINVIFEETGGAGHWSNSVYELNDYLKKENKTIGALDWGYTNNLIVLSKSQLKIKRLYTSVWKNVDVNNYMKENLSDSIIYLVYSEKYTTFPVVKNVFFETAKEAGYDIILEKEFYQGSGEVVHRVFKLKKD